MRTTNFDPATGEVQFRGRWYEAESDELAESQQAAEDAQLARAEQMREEREEDLDG